jgi:hypothetical protein
MNLFNKKYLNCLGALVLCFTSASQAWSDVRVRSGYGNGNIHGHGEDIRVYNHGGYSPYDQGGYYFNNVPTIIVPNVIINTAPVRRYAPFCRDVEVCTPYDECWIERYCN